MTQFDDLMAGSGADALLLQHAEAVDVWTDSDNASRTPGTEATVQAIVKETRDRDMATMWGQYDVSGPPTLTVLIAQADLATITPGLQKMRWRGDVYTFKRLLGAEAGFWLINAAR